MSLETEIQLLREAITTLTAAIQAAPVAATVVEPPVAKGKGKKADTVTYPPQEEVVVPVPPTPPPVAAVPLAPPAPPTAAVPTPPTAVPAPPTAPAGSSDLTLEQLNDQVVAFAQLSEANPPKVFATLAQFGVHGLSQLAKDRYQEFLDALKAVQ